MENSSEEGGVNLGFWGWLKRILTYIVMIIAIVCLIIALCVGMGWFTAGATGVWASMIALKATFWLVLGAVLGVVGYLIDPAAADHVLEILGNAAGDAASGVVNVVTDVVGSAAEALGRSLGRSGLFTILLVAAGGFIILNKDGGTDVSLEAPTYGT